MAAASPQWDCTNSACKHKNPIKADWCEKCGQTWSCTVCTFVNNATHPDCIMCQSPGPMKISDKNKNEMKCPVCTFQQAKTNSHCQICGNSLHSQQKGNLNHGYTFPQHNNNNSNNNDFDYGSGQNWNNNNSNNNSKNNNHSHSNGSHLNGYNKKTNRDSQSMTYSSSNKFEPYSLHGHSNKHNHNHNHNHNNGFNHNYNGAYNDKYNNNNTNNNNKQNKIHDSGNYDFSSMFGVSNDNDNLNSNFDYMGGFSNMIHSISNSNKNKNKHKSRSMRGRGRGRHGNRKNRHQQMKDVENKTMFKDVSEIMKKDANDKERIEKEERDVEALRNLYNYVYAIDLAHRNPNDKRLSQHKSTMNNNTLRNTLISMLQFAPKPGDENKNDNNSNSNSNSNSNNNEIKMDNNDNDKQCQVCFGDYDVSHPQIQMKGDCNHSILCSRCFKEHLKVKIKHDDCTPWLQCPAPDCTANIHVDLIMQHCQTPDIYHFASIFLIKHLRRNPNWVDCETKGCDFGWKWLQSDKTKTKRLQCAACNKTKNISKKEIDSELEELIKSGTMKKCPKCKWPTMKDKGMCNIMHCGRCDIYWNWQTFEMANNSKTLKNRARNNGTLWEPGELNYQRKLQKENLPEFIKLLERNGIKYDPNYMRGT